MVANKMHGWDIGWDLKEEKMKSEREPVPYSEEEIIIIKRGTYQMLIKD
jgi:hypothetical protein